MELGAGPQLGREAKLGAGPQLGWEAELDVELWRGRSSGGSPAAPRREGRHPLLAPSMA